MRLADQVRPGPARAPRGRAPWRSGRDMWLHRTVKRVATVLALLSTMLVAAGCGDGDEPQLPAQDVRIATGLPGGVYNPYGRALAGVINRHGSPLRASARSTEGLGREPAAARRARGRGGLQPGGLDQPGAARRASVPPPRAPGGVGAPVRRLRAGDRAPRVRTARRRRSRAQAGVDRRPELRHGVDGPAHPEARRPAAGRRAGAAGPATGPRGLGEGAAARTDRRVLLERRAADDGHRRSARTRAHPAARAAARDRRRAGSQSLHRDRHPARAPTKAASRSARWPQPTCSSSAAICPRRSRSGSPVCCSSTAASSRRLTRRRAGSISGRRSRRIRSSLHPGAERWYREARR